MATSGSARRPAGRASACGTAAPWLWTPARLTVPEAVGSSDLGAHPPGGCRRFLRGQPQMPAEAETESDRLTKDCSWEITSPERKEYVQLTIEIRTGTLLREGIFREQERP